MHPGYYRNITMEKCLACPPGTFSSSPGSSYCTRCPFDQISAAASSQCSLCPPGYLSNTLSTSCAICDMGYFKSQSAATCGASCCSRCPPDSYSSVTDSPQCTSCEPNTWLSYREPCIKNACPTGFINSTTTRSCIACPAGSRQLGALTLNLLCFSCVVTIKSRECMHRLSFGLHQPLLSDVLFNVSRGHNDASISDKSVCTLPSRFGH
jgi:hypothetical protein